MPRLCNLDRFGASLADGPHGPGERHAPGRSVATGTKPPGPRRVERRELGGGHRADLDELESVRGERRDHPRAGSGIDVTGEAGHGRRVATGDRQRELEPTGRCDEAGDRPGHDGIEAERTPEQRGPREPDRHSIRDARQLRWQALDAGGQEPGPPGRRIRMPPSGSPRRFGHRARVRIDTEDERLGICQDLGQHGPAVAGPEVDDDPAVPPGQVEDLADVHLGDAPAGDGMHGWSMVHRRWPVPGGRPQSGILAAPHPPRRTASP